MTNQKNNISWIIWIITANPVNLKILNALNKYLYKNLAIIIPITKIKTSAKTAHKWYFYTIFLKNIIIKSISYNIIKIIIDNEEYIYYSDQHHIGVSNKYIRYTLYYHHY